jgi:hypothetical protein
VLVDTHWVGGDPGKGEVYGWASWSPRKAILVLRNPDDKPAIYKADARELFELPSGTAGKFLLSSPWIKDRGRQATELAAGQPKSITLQPFEVLVLQTGQTTDSQQSSSLQQHAQLPSGP